MQNAEPHPSFPPAIPVIPAKAGIHSPATNTIEDFLRAWDRRNYALDSARKKIVTISRMFAQQHGLRWIFARALSREDRVDLLDWNSGALDALNLGNETWDSYLEHSSIIAEVTNLHSRNDPQYYIAVEASFTGHNKDVTRATDHAKIIRCATGLDAHAVVAAVRLDPNIDSDRILEDIEEYLDTANENTALWFPLVEEDLEPPDPC